MANKIINELDYEFIKKDENPKAENGRNNGIKREPDNKFNYNKADCETVIPSDANEKNTYIVFGRDRPGDWSSGYGGKGHEKCSSIDIVVGRTSAFKGRDHKDEYVNPSIGADASRIYLSQKADIDDYYGISDGRTGKSKARAAIAIKSDDIRIVARNTIKIVTERDSRLSADDPNFSLTGVQLIANNDSKNMQPIPKGEQLVKFILELQQCIEELNANVYAFMEIQKQFNFETSFHLHRSPFWGEFTWFADDFIDAAQQANSQLQLKVEQGLKNQINNLTSVVLKYVSGGPDYINSKYHFLN